MPVQKRVKKVKLKCQSTETEIKVSLCKKSGIHQPIRLRKDGFTARKKSIEFAESNLLSVLEAEVKLSNIADQYDI